LSAWVELIEGGCLEVMPALEAGSIDMILTDLPYGTTQNAWDQMIQFAPMWAEFWRLFASQPFSSALTMSQVERFRYEWVWEKNKATGHLNAKKMPMKAHEQVLVFSLGKHPYYPQMTDGHEPMHAYVQTSNGSNYGSTKRPAGGGSTQRYPRSVQRFPVVNNDNPEKVHPTQKPVEWCEYLIRTYTQPGDTVLSACFGSGTVGVAARNLGRNCIGIESDPAYYAAAEKRLWPEGVPA
jgi:DNA modification methylase